jgi:hypothetical protein
VSIERNRRRPGANRFFRIFRLKRDNFEGAGDIPADPEFGEFGTARWLACCSEKSDGEVTALPFAKNFSAVAEIDKADDCRVARDGKRSD